MARMDRFITITAGDFTSRTWAERIDRQSGAFERDDAYGGFRFYRTYRIRYTADLAGIPAQRIEVTDDSEVSWTVESVQEESNRNRYMTLECFR